LAVVVLPQTCLVYVSHTEFLTFRPPGLNRLGNSSKGMGPSEICIPPSAPKRDDTIIQHGFLSTTMPRLHAAPPPHPCLPRPRYATVSMYVSPMGKFPPFLTAIFHFINVLLVSALNTLQPPLAPSLLLLPPLLLFPLPSLSPYCFPLPPSSIIIFFLP
jgi:hypothetical protein